jgi:hypothetical protein
MIEPALLLPGNKRSSQALSAVQDRRFDWHQGDAKPVRKRTRRPSSMEKRLMAAKKAFKKRIEF